MRKLFSLVAIIGIGWYYAINNGLSIKALGVQVKKEQAANWYKETVGQVLGVTTSKLKETLIKTTAKELIKQADKLPADQKAELKKAVCE
ncbi:hypothetical protein HY214_03375 [Candidatus Roizmanbacteria bacterium]|nr:hypothetical protein [Candidatus Roizmanbacteria bacterium]